ncbi:MAG TPA: PAS domain S-box protein [Deltaproteobacteria bacterium]|nr:PAS domain S-box protein [Deltaproteobacteria bacterium]HPP79571.1 PAS domain S-box protein [Deltaproteobacteria bacterium]
MSSAPWPFDRDGSLTDSRRTRHACCLYRAAGEGFELLKRLLVPTLEHGGRCLCLCGRGIGEGIPGILSSSGLDPEGLVRSGRLAISTTEGSCTVNGLFDASLMAATLARFLGAAPLGTRDADLLVVDVDWMPWNASGGAVDPARIETWLAPFTSTGLGVKTAALYGMGRFTPAQVMALSLSQEVLVVNLEVVRNRRAVSPAGLSTLIARRELSEAQLHAHLDLLSGQAASAPEETRRIADTERPDKEPVETAAALRASERHFRDIFEAFPLAYLAVDPEGRILEANPAFAALSGYGRSEVIGKHLHEFSPDDSRDLVREVLGTLLNSGLVRSADLPVLKKDGHVVNAAIDGVFVCDERGLPSVAHVVVRDVTLEKEAERERERLQAQLAKADRLESLGRLAGGVAHDFNNMLGVIMGHAELALEACGPHGALRPHLSEIRSASERSASIVRQLLAYARRQPRAPVLLDLNATVQSVLSMIRTLIGENISLVWLPGKDLWSVEMDPAQVDQVVMNLCTNARDAISGQGTVVIETMNRSFDAAYCTEHMECAPGDYVLLSVTDTGCGMDRDTSARIFDPFFSTKEPGSGTGLGLSTVYGIARQNGGFINVYTEQGKGTTLKVYLPRSMKAAHDLAEPPGPASLEVQDRVHGLTVLVVEDDRASLQTTSILLERMGHRVLGAQSPAEALVIASERGHAIDLILSDVIMPGMNGRELARRVEEMAPGIACLFMSGYTENIIVHRGVIEPGLHFIQKPFTRRELEVKMREALADSHGGAAPPRTGPVGREGRGP